MNAKNSITNNLEFKAFDGTKPDHFVLKPNEKVQWKVFLPEAGEYSLESSLYNGSGKDAKIVIRDNKNILSAIAKPNGKVTVEPNENWYVEEFLDIPVGRIKINKPQELILEFSAEEAVLFNRIWLEKK